MEKISSEIVHEEVGLFMRKLKEREANQPEYIQAVQEVVESLMPIVLSEPRLQKAKILERLVEPDRVVRFRVVWEDDAGEVCVNRGWRVQFNNVLGPYKGGLRFHSSVNESILKFLAFEQIFKNSLTGLALGGGKGGSDFDPRGRSDREIMRFCQSFMRSLYSYIGSNTDVPAGDIGVSAREIGYLYGSYRRLRNEHTGVITGKGLEYGGSELRTEATGYGAVYFAEHMLGRVQQGFAGQRVLVSGSGNVALYCLKKLAQLGASPVTASDSSGYIYDPNGIVGERFEFLRQLKEVRRGRIHEYAEKYNDAKFVPSKRPWEVGGAIAFPCATQNEVCLEEAKALVEGGLLAIVEGANMPCTADAAKYFEDRGILFGPAKAANAGGVAVSGLEMSQNASRTAWSAAEVDQMLRKIMGQIHDRCVQYGQEDGRMSYIRGANVGGFWRVANVMLAFGLD